MRSDDDGAVVVAAPSDNTVSGETALVGLMKAFPTCAGGEPADEQRVRRLAYQQLAVVSAMAGTDANLPQASAAFLDVVSATVSGQAQNASGIGAAIDAATGARGLTVTDSTRDQVVSYFEQLGGFDYGPYSHGLAVQAASDTEIRVTPAE